ncbi:hypothetical protein [Escherichia coli]|uniref:hypothetical protein n=1 Tax=Escherichia coli TaxID=562 RepID=UPI003D657586
MIENQQAQSVSEMLKYSPVRKCRRAVEWMSGVRKVGDAGQRGGQQPSGRAEYRFNNRVSGGNAERMDVLNSLTGALYGRRAQQGSLISWRSAQPKRRCVK